MPWSLEVRMLRAVEELVPGSPKSQEPWEENEESQGGQGCRGGIWHLEAVGDF